MESETFDYRNNKKGKGKNEEEFSGDDYLPEPDIPEFDPVTDMDFSEPLADPAERHDTLYAGGNSNDNGNNMNSSGSAKWRIILALLLGLIVGFGSAWLFLNKPEPSTENTDGQTTQETDNNGGNVTDNDDGNTVENTLPPATDTTIEENVVLVKDQAAGDEVFISRVALNRLGWVVIHEDLNGQPGNILGAKIFDPGDYPAGTVPLLRATTPGTYYAILRADDGDRQFDFTKDLTITDESGNIVLMQFEVYGN